MTNLINRIKKIMFTKDNKHSDIEFGKNEIRQEIIFYPKKPSKAVMELARKFKNVNENVVNLYENNTSFPNNQIENDNLYIHFEKYILTNSNGIRLPKNYDIENHLGINEGKRKELFKIARERGLIIRKNDTRSILNLNYEEGECNAE